jgi:hypothetical protein
MKISKKTPGIRENFNPDEDLAETNQEKKLVERRYTGYQETLPRHITQEALDIVTCFPR